MNCAEISDLTPLWLTGELDPARKAAFANHLLHCRVCVTEIERQKSLDNRVRIGVLAEVLDVSALTAEIRGRIDRDSERRRPVKWPWLAVAASLAAVLLLAVAGYRALIAARTRALDAAAARDHHTEIVERQPRRWRTTLASVADLAGSQGIAAPLVAAIAPPGYHLEQGRLCRLNGRLFLHLVYTDGVRNISVFLGPPGSRTGQGDPHVRSATFSAEQVAGFQNRQFNAIVVANPTTRGDNNADNSTDNNAALHFAQFAARVI